MQYSAYGKYVCGLYWVPHFQPQSGRLHWIFQILTLKLKSLLLTSDFFKNKNLVT